jgi:hypothetical protein
VSAIDGREFVRMMQLEIERGMAKILRRSNERGEKDVTDLNAIRARLGSLPESRLATLPPSVLRLVADIPMLLAKVEKYESALREIDLMNHSTFDPQRTHLPEMCPHCIARTALADGGGE